MAVVCTGEASHAQLSNPLVASSPSIRHRSLGWAKNGSIARTSIPGGRNPPIVVVATQTLQTASAEILDATLHEM